MTKKIVIAVVAVVVALLIIKGTWLGSHVRLWVKQATTSVEASIPLEREIERLEMEVENLKKEEVRLFDEVVRRGIEVKKLEKQVKEIRDDLTVREERIKLMRHSLVGEDTFVNYKGERFKREHLQDELRRTGANFRIDEKTLASKEEQLSLKREDYESHRKLRSELELSRQEMLTELERLKTDLARERHLMAAEKKTIATPGFEKVRKDMDRVRDRIEELKLRREMRGEAEGPVRAFEQRKKELEEIDNYLETRFADDQ